MYLDHLKRLVSIIVITTANYRPASVKRLVNVAVYFHVFIKVRFSTQSACVIESPFHANVSVQKQNGCKPGCQMTAYRGFELASVA